MAYNLYEAASNIVSPEKYDTIFETVKKRFGGNCSRHAGGFIVPKVGGMDNFKRTHNLHLYNLPIDFHDLL